MKAKKLPLSAVSPPVISKIPHQILSNGTLGAGLDTVGPDAVTPPSTLALIRKLIDTHKTYPAKAQNSGVSGRVSVNFAIDKTGSLRYVTVVKTSGSVILDEAAVDAVKKSVPFPYIVSPITLALDYQLEE
jgi:TonB family protein